MVSYTYLLIACVIVTNAIIGITEIIILIVIGRNLQSNCFIFKLKW